MEFLRNSVQSLRDIIAGGGEENAAGGGAAAASSSAAASGSAGSAMEDSGGGGDAAGGEGAGLDAASRLAVCNRLFTLRMPANPGGHDRWPSGFGALTFVSQACCKTMLPAERDEADKFFAYQVSTETGHAMMK
jgi:hypothetical protein